MPAQPKRSPFVFNLPDTNNKSSKRPSFDFTPPEQSDSDKTDTRPAFAFNPPQPLTPTGRWVSPYVPVFLDKLDPPF